MSDSSKSAKLVQSLASYLPPAVARKIRTGPLTNIHPHVERFEAAVLFADISGFTSLNEQLIQADENGVEELTVLLNHYYSRMIVLLESEGGEVVQFSGDALLAVFSNQQAAGGVSSSPAKRDENLQANVRRAWQAAAQMQRAMADFTRLQSSLGLISLDMTIAVGAGEVAAFLVGGVLGHWQYVIAGDPMRQVRAASAKISVGEIILSPEAKALFSRKAIQTKPLRPLQWQGVSSETINALHRHVPDIVSRRLQSGQDNWLAELRRMTVLFIKIQGLEYDVSTALNQLQRLIEAFQKTAYHYDGSLNKLLIDDKGTVAVILFGAPPRSHEDDPLRAVRCALELQTIAHNQQLQLAIGITSGKVFAGPIGSNNRREYSVIGNIVNVAARLMQLAGFHGDVHSDFATYQATKDQIEWQSLLPQTVKGKAAAIRVYRPLGLRSGAQTDDQATPLIGRGQILTRLDKQFQHFLAGNLQVVFLEGDPGIGKSRLVRSLIQKTQETGLVGLSGNGDVLEQRTPYNAWRDIFRSYFDLDGEPKMAGDRNKIVEQVTAVVPELQDRIGLLNDLFPVDLPETPMTRNFYPKLRQSSLTSLLVELLRTWAQEQPLVLLLEDAQWLDSLSWRLALNVAQSLPDLPILLVVATRPFAPPKPDHPYHQLIALTQTQHIFLNEMKPASIVKLVAKQLNVDDLPQEIGEFISHRSAGNPFVAKELAHSLRDSGAIRIVNGQCFVIGHLSELQVPDSLHSLVLSRIDRLPPQEQLTLKVASVIGRSFGIGLLRYVISTRLDDDQLQDSMANLIENGILHELEDPTSFHSHIFKQAIFQEVTHSTLLQKQRKELHARTAGWFERYAPSPDFYPILAHHWRQAQETQRELGYAILSGHKLAADYANSEALNFLDRALKLSASYDTQYELYTLRVEVHKRVGDREARENDLKQLQALVKQQGNFKHQAEVANAWADYYRSISDYDAAMIAVRVGRQAAMHSNDQASEAQSLTIQGQILEHQGEYKDARMYFVMALEQYQQLGDHQGAANNLSHISNVYRYLGDNGTAVTYAKQALDIRRQIGDKAKEAVSLYNLGLIATELGEIKEAKSYHQQSYQIAQAIGDRSGEALSLSAIGFDYLMQGDLAAAQQHLQQALQLHQMMNERLREADCLNALGAVWRDVGNDRNAQRSFERALAIQKEIGSYSFVAYTYLNLGLVNLQFNTPAAQAYYKKALKYARETGNRDAEAYALSYIGGLNEYQQAWQTAGKFYKRALSIRRELQAAAAAIEDTAALARVALKQGKEKKALKLAQTCARYLIEKGVAGMEFPLMVYISCYDVLRRTGQEADTRQLLADAYILLMQRASAISDPIMRAGLLQNVPVNQRILAEWRNQNEETD